jgi:hypothetical protein
MTEEEMRRGYNAIEVKWSPLRKKVWKRNKILFAASRMPILSDYTTSTHLTLTASYHGSEENISV